MAALRRFNALGQLRVDVPHFRLVEEAIAGDFDLMAGRMMAGGIPLFLKGFTISTANVTQASRLTMQVAGGLLVHPTASDGGTIYGVEDDASDEVLSSSNAAVVGAFAPSQANFVGIDLVLAADDTTTDLAMFLSTATFEDEGRRVPLGRTMQHRIVISTVDPSATPNVAPVAKVVTDSANNVVSVTDIRNRMFRLALGGGVPDSTHTFPWTNGRTDSTSFGVEVGDKQLGSSKDFYDALMTRVWELGGGERWFATTSDRNIILTGLGSTFGSSGEFLEWDGTNLHWQGLAAVFDNSTSSINEIADQTSDSSGLTDLADGECVYVDLDRATDRTGGSALVAAKAPLTQLGTPAVPGSRWIFAWRRSTEVYYRGKLGPIGSLTIPTATTSILGNVYLSAAPATAGQPVVPSLNAAGAARAAGLTRAGAVTGHGVTLGNGPIAIASDATADTGVTYGNTSMAGGHVFDGVAGSAQVVLTRNNTDRAVTPATKVATWQQNDGAVLKDVLHILGSGGLQVPLRLATPVTPASNNAALSLRLNGSSSPNSRLQVVVMWPDGTETVIAEGPAS